MAAHKRDTYRVVAVSLYQHEALEADRLAEILKRVGWPKANRSLVVREALLLLEEALMGQDDERVFRYFVERYARRLGGGSGARRHSQPGTGEHPNDRPEDTEISVPAADAADDSRRRH